MLFTLIQIGPQQWTAQNNLCQTLTLQMHATEKSKWNVTSWMDQPYQKLTKWVYWLQYAVDICCETHCKLRMSSTISHPHCVGGCILIFFMKWIWEICIVMGAEFNLESWTRCAQWTEYRLGFPVHKMVMIRSIINMISSNLQYRVPLLSVSIKYEKNQVPYHTWKLLLIMQSVSPSFVLQYRACPFAVFKCEKKQVPY